MERKILDKLEQLDSAFVDMSKKIEQINERCEIIDDRTYNRLKKLNIEIDAINKNIDIIYRSDILNKRMLNEYERRLATLESNK